MRALALILLLSACQIQPGSTASNAKLLNEIKGPDVGSVDATLLESARQSEKAGDYNRAAIFYSQLMDKNSGNVEYRIAHADVLRRAGRIDEAQKAFEEMLAKDPNNVAALEGKMLCRFARGELAETGDLAKKIMAIDANRWRTLNVVGILFASRNMTDEAMAYYERALTISRDNPSILNNVGLTLAMDKQYDKAVQALSRAVSLAPADSSQRLQLDMNLALVYGVSGDMDMAEKIAGRHLSGPALYNNLGYYAKLAKNDTAARDYFNMALTKSPTYYARAWNNLETVSGKPTPETDKNVKVKAGKPISQKLSVSSPKAEPVLATEEIN